MSNDSVITEKDYPIEPIWILRKTLPSISQFPIFFVLFYLFILRGSRDLYFTLFFTAFFVVFFFLPIPIQFSVNLLRRKNFHYSLGDKFFDLKQGILSKQNRHIPYGVIQNVILTRGLLDRIFGLASLTIENASEGGGLRTVPYVQAGKRGEMIGFRGNVVHVPGLSFENAQELKNIILERVKANPIEELGL